MAEQEQLDIVISLRDEASETAKTVRAAMGRLKNEAKIDAEKQRERAKQFSNAVEYGSREVGTIVRNLGVQGAFVSGGLVASLTAISSAMTGFTQSSLQLRSSARILGLTVEQVQKFQYALQASGVSQDAASSQVATFAARVQDLRKGLESSTRSELAKSFQGIQGNKLADQITNIYKKEGLEPAMRAIMKMMADAGEKNDDNSQWIVQTLSKIFGIDPSSTRALALIDRFKGVTQPSEEAASNYLIEQVKLEVALTNFRNKVAVAILPTLTQLTEYLGTFVNSGNMEKFAESLRAFGQSLVDTNWDEVRQTIDRALTGIGTELGAFARDTYAIVKTLNEVVQMVDQWKTENKWNYAKPIAYQNNPFAESGEQPQFFDDSIWNRPAGKLYTVDEDAEDFEKRRFHPDINFIPGAPESENIEDRREYDPTMPGDRAEPGWTRAGRGGVGSGRRQNFMGNGGLGQLQHSLQQKTLLDRTLMLKIEFQRLADGLRDKRNGLGGGNTEGGVTEKGRNRPMDTKAGGRGGPLPVSPGMPPPGRQVVKGSWFGQFKDAMGSVLPKGWIDPDDMHTSGPKKGQPLGNYGGYSQETPGVAIPFKGTAGRPEKMEASPIRVWDLNKVGPGVRSHLVRQVDIGPNQAKAPSNEKGIDINSPLAERMGYAPDKDQSKATGRPVFPTGGRFGYEVVSQGNMLRTLRDMEVERKRFSGEPINWSRHQTDNALNGFDNGPRGQLELNVNVRGPRGVKADAEVSGGDFIPADRGVKVNREMTSGDE